MSKLWQNKMTKEINPIIMNFLAGSDAILDNSFVEFDIKGTRAHVDILLAAEIITKTEKAKITKVLNQLEKDFHAGKVKVTVKDEDCHTMIENYLVCKLGNLGKKIHTGRSRNDQVLTMIRLFMSTKYMEIKASVVKLQMTLKNKAKKYKGLLMPGYTHSQKGMPVGLDIFFMSFYDSLVDDMNFFKNTMKIIEQSPLGSAAGFGLPFSWPKKEGLKELGYKKVQNNPIYCQASRPKFDKMFLFALEMIATSINRLAADLLLFTMPDFAFFALPDEFTTGSSIMPNKKNYDLFELARATRATLTSASLEAGLYGFNLISGYHRDYQSSKKILIESVINVSQLINVMNVGVQNLIIDKDKIKAGLTDEMYSAEKALKLAKKGVPFREAYMQIKSELHSSGQQLQKKKKDRYRSN